MSIISLKAARLLTATAEGKKLSASHKAVLYTLAEVADESGSTATYGRCSSYDWIANYSGLCRRATIRICRELESMGVLVVQRERLSVRKNAINCYHLPIFVGGEVILPSGARCPSKQPSSGNEAPSKDTLVACSHHGDASQSPQVVKHEHQPSDPYAPGTVNTVNTVLPPTPHRGKTVAGGKEMSIWKMHTLEDLRNDYSITISAPPDSMWVEKVAYLFNEHCVKTFNAQRVNRVHSRLQAQIIDRYKD